MAQPRIKTEQQSNFSKKVFEAEQSQRKKRSSFEILRRLPSGMIRSRCQIHIPLFRSCFLASKEQITLNNIKPDSKKIRQNSKNAHFFLRLEENRVKSIETTDCYLSYLNGLSVITEEYGSFAGCQSMLIHGINLLLPPYPKITFGRSFGLPQ